MKNYLYTYFFFIIFCSLCNPIKLEAQNYQEKYRPQFHFSPASGWIGDVAGAFRFQDKYRLYWWGQATSEDLVYWKELGWPMKGDNGTFDYYTGSVVVDQQNTTGFGSIEQPPIIAIYTMHNKQNSIESQGISHSINGNYDELHYYENNPVIPSNNTDFRDPQVFWDNQTNRWIMVITRPLDRAIEFYASDDLKNWQFLSKFGQEGAQKEVWEVPDLFQLPLDGDPNNKKWVLTCGMGPNRVQYWVGNFDGMQFYMDSTSYNYLHKATGLKGEVFANFENGFQNWSTEGEAFGVNPINASLPEQMRVSGFINQYFISSYHGGDDAKGTLVSPEFTINNNFINFLCSGGNKPVLLETRLYINDKLTYYTTGNNSEQFVWKSWDLSAYKGQKAYIKIVDNATGGWGHINVDHFIFSDQSMGTNAEHAYWADWGKDFYASKTFRDYDKVDNEVVWMAWMNSWEYAHSIPTVWGQSTCHTIPRSLHLVTSSTQGYNLVQSPIEGLKKLRKDLVTVNNSMVEGTQLLQEFTPSKNVYELEAEFVLNGENNQDFGLNLCVDGQNKLVLGYDAHTGEVYLDRRQSNDVIIPNFNLVSKAPVSGTHTNIKFHVFIDQMSAEVFINDGEQVISSLIFPSKEALDIELFSNQGVTKLKYLNAWELESIWDKSTVIEKVHQDAKSGNDLMVYPNPVFNNDMITIPFLDKNEVAQLSIYSITGKLLSCQNLSGDKNTVRANLNPGIFYLKLDDNSNYSRVQKLVVK